MKAHIGRYPKDPEKGRKISIRVDKWDTWNADHTIALIAHPLLVQLHETKHGAPFTDDDDVPEHLRSINAEPKENEWDLDSLHFARWDWIMQEMIWAMYQIVTHREEENKFFTFHKDIEDLDEGPTNFSDICTIDRKGLDEYNARLQNGCRLFGKYFQNLWD